MSKIISLFVLFLFCNSVLIAQNEFYYRATDPQRMNPEMSVAAVGDLMLGSWVVQVLQREGDFYPYSATHQHLKSADVAIANLEAPFTNDGEPFEKRFNFKVPPEHAAGILQSGIDVLNLANNHMLDYGPTGLINTLTTLDSLGLKHSGANLNFEAAHEPAIITVNGRTLAFFGYSMTFPTEFYARADTAGTAYPEPPVMQESIRRWNNLVDLVVVSFHWGAEKRVTPKEYQVEFAHLAIDSGADLVLGHHPHVLQGLEIYRGKLIAYSLGNYAFGSYSEHSKDSIILKVYFDEAGLMFARCIPINVYNTEVEFQPRRLTGSSSAQVIEHIKQLSAPLNQGIQIVDDSGFIFGSWADFYQELLLDTVIKTYWKISDIRDFRSEMNTLTTRIERTSSAISE